MHSSQNIWSNRRLILSRQWACANFAENFLDARSATVFRFAAFMKAADLPNRNGDGAQPIRRAEVALPGPGGHSAIL